MMDIEDKKGKVRHFLQATGLQGFLSRWFVRIKGGRWIALIYTLGFGVAVDFASFLTEYTNVYGVILGEMFLLSSGMMILYGYEQFFMKSEAQQMVRRRDNFVGEQLVLNHMGMMHMFSEVFDVEFEEMENNYNDFVKQYRNGVDMEDLSNADK